MRFSNSVLCETETQTRNAGLTYQPKLEDSPLCCWTVSHADQSVFSSNSA